MTVAIGKASSSSSESPKKQQINEQEQQHPLIQKLLSSMQPFSQSQPQQQGSYGQQQTFQRTQEGLGSWLEKVRDCTQNCIQNTTETMRVYVNKYPPLAAFLFTLMILSVVPISVYVFFGLVTSAIFLTIALISFSVVEGFILLSTGGILLMALGTIGLFSSVAFVLISGVYLSWRGGSALFGQVWESAQNVGGPMAQRMQQQMGTSGYPSSGSNPMGTSGPSSS